MNEKDANSGTPEGKGFVRGLGLLDATTLVVGSMIGSGIFIVSADIARQVGSPAAFLSIWTITGLMTVGAALCYGELAAMMPKAGGQYVYLREAWSPMVGFLYGWTLFLVIQTGTVAAVSVAFAKFLGVFWPAVSEKEVVLDLGEMQLFGGEYRPSVSTQQVVAILTLVILTAVNLCGVKTGARVQNLFTSLKVAALVGLTAAGFVFGIRGNVPAMNWDHFFSEQPFSFATLPAIGAAMVGALFAADAWNNVTFSSEEVEDAGHNLAKAMGVGAALVCLLYLAANISYLLVLPMSGSDRVPDPSGRGIAYAAEDRVATAAAEVLLGGAGTYLVAGAIMISTFGCINGMVLTGARAYFAMARDGLFFRPVGRLSAKTRVPAVALVLQGTWACLLTLSGTYGQLLDYVIFAALLFYVLTIAGMIRLRLKRNEIPRPFRAPAFPFLPVLYIVTAAFIMGVLLVCKPGYTWPGLFIVALGVPVYYCWRTRTGSGQESEQ